MKNILIVDYNQSRIDNLRKLLQGHFSKDYVVYDLLTNQPPPIGQTYNRDEDKLSQIQQRDYSLLIGHMAGNPSGADCLHRFKKHNPKGRAMFYTKRDQIGIDEFSQFRFANMIFRRSNNDNVVFDNPIKMTSDIEAIMAQKGIDYVRGILDNKTVVTAGLGMLAAIIGLAAALVKAMT